MPRLVRMMAIQRAPRRNGFIYWFDLFMATRLVLRSPMALMAHDDKGIWRVTWEGWRSLLDTPRVCRRVVKREARWNKASDKSGKTFLAKPWPFLLATCHVCGEKERDGDKSRISWWATNGCRLKGIGLAKTVPGTGVAKQKSYRWISSCVRAHLHWIGTCWKDKCC